MNSVLALATTVIFLMALRAMEGTAGYLGSACA
jgi:hypothetical protein